MLAVAKSIIAQRQQVKVKAVATAAVANGRISEATRRKISETLKRKNAAKKMTALLEQRGPLPTPPPSKGKGARSTGGGIEPRITLA
jgi:uncharacterized membrane protein YebE (DUF533 family)